MLKKVLKKEKVQQQKEGWVGGGKVGGEVERKMVKNVLFLV